MANPANSVIQNLLPVQAYFSVDGVFQTFIGQGQPFYATLNPIQSGLTITNSTIDSSTIGATSPSTGVFTNIATTTGTISTSPSANTDIANKYYVDAVAQGLGPKAACAVGTTTNITLSGLQTIDGYTTLSGDRVLVKNQSSSQFNGIYVASASTWTRAVDMDVWSEVSGAYTVILNGGQANTGYVCTAAKTGTIDVTAMPWVQFSGTGTYFAGTGLTLASNTFSITNTGVSAASVGSASKTLTATVNAQGQLTALADTNIAIGATQITSGTIDTARISGSYTGITGVGTLTAGIWNASTIGVAYGGTGATTLTGYVKGSGTSAFTASATVPTTDLSGTISNAQLANSTISGVSLGSNLFSLTIGSNLSGTSYNGSAAVTITNTAPMVYPASGIPNSTGSAWGTSYSTTGSGTVLALATGATLNSPTVSDYATFTAASAPTYTSGRLWYDTTLKALSYNNDVTNNTIHIGQETQLKVYNNTGSTIAKGAPVYITSTTSGFTYPLIALAKADTQTTGACIGLTNESIATGSEGYVVISGILNGVNTGTFTVGDILYVSPYSAGQLMNTYPPTAYAVKIGTVAYVNSSNGSIYVNQSNAYVLSNGIIGTVAIANGGTNGTATPTAGGIAYGSGTAYAFSAAGTTGQVLTSNGSGTPTWTSPASSITLSDDTTTNATRYPLYAAATSGTISTEYVSSTKLQFNPSTGVFTSTSFSGAGTGLTGTATSLSIGGNAATATSATSATTATNLAGGANGSVPYQTGSGATTFLAAGTNGYVMTLASGVPTWAAAASSGITISDDTTTNATRYLTFTSATSGSITSENVSSTKLQFNPSTGALTSTSFSGAGTGLTGTAASLSIGGNSANVTGIVAEANGGTGTTTGYYGFKNRIINGAMVIDQRNAGASVTPAAFTYTLDRWAAVQTTASKFSVQQNAASVTPPVGFNNYLGVTSLSAYSVGAGDTFNIYQSIEGFNSVDLAWGTANAKAVTLSFWVRSSLTGTFGGAIKDGSSTNAYPFTYSIASANTWTQISVTIPGPTAGQFSYTSTTNGTGIQIQFGLGAGANYSGTAGAWAAFNAYTATGAVSVVGTNGATWYVTGVQFEKGSTATSFDYRPYGTEMTLCQRYYEVMYNSSDGAGVWGPFTTAAGYRGTWYFKVQKRTAASVSLAGSSAWTGSTPSIFGGLSSAAFFNGTTYFYSSGATDALSLQASAEL
jgi:hypothetical protein